MSSGREWMKISLESFVEDYCKDSDIRIIKKIIDEVCQEESEED